MSGSGNALPDGLIAYGSDTNCTLAICPLDASVYEYRPSLAANGTFIALFAISGILHLLQAFRFKGTWWFSSCMVIGCIDEVIGYIGRIMIHNNPFSFNGFLIQIICITIGPVFYTAAIYFTLSRLVVYLGRQYSRFPPQLFYYVFIPSDIISLVLQATGGAMSSTSSGSDQSGVNISLGGLSFQVFSLLVFISLTIDYVLRRRRHRSREQRDEVQHQVKSRMPFRFKSFVIMLSLAITLILIRCAYRIAELRQGYNGSLFHDEGLFIALEGVMILAATFCLNVEHPGNVLANDAPTPPSEVETLPKA